MKRKSSSFVRKFSIISQRITKNTFLKQWASSQKWFLFIVESAVLGRAVRSESHSLTNGVLNRNKKPRHAPQYYSKETWGERENDPVADTWFRFTLNLHATNFRRFFYLDRSISHTCEWVNCNRIVQWAQTSARTFGQCMDKRILWFAFSREWIAVHCNRFPWKWENEVW